MAQGRVVGGGLAEIIAKIEVSLSEVKEQFLINVSGDLIESSPVWSGDYVTSHSIGVTPTAGRFTGNIGEMKEKTSNPGAYRANGMSSLLKDIYALPEGAERVYISNSAPHANIVEHGNANVIPHKVYESVLNRANGHLQDAVNRVKARQ